MYIYNIYLQYISMNRGNSSTGFFNRALKLFTIFIVLGIMLTTFVYSAEISRSSIIKNSNSPILTVQDISNPKYTRTIVDKTDNKVNTIFDYMVFFKITDKTLSYNNKSDFTIGLKEFIHAKTYSGLDLTMTQSPEHLDCDINNYRLICSVLDKYSGSDELVLELYDAKFKLKSALKLNFNLTNNYVLPTFNDLEETITLNEDETLNFDFTQFVNNPDNVLYNVNISLAPTYANCNVTNDYKLNCTLTKDYFGSDSLELKINESGSTMNVLLNIEPVNDAPILDNSKLTNGYVEMNVNDGIHTIVNLEDYVIDPDYPRSYTYELIGVPTFALCSIYDNKLDCTGLKTGNENFNILLTDDKLSLNIPVHVLVYKNNEPVLDNSKLTNGKILINITDKIPVTTNLKNYVIDIDDVKNYTYEIQTNPTIANCSIANDNLTCTKIKDGLESFTIKLTDDIFTLNLPIEVQVITPIVPPQYLNNFIDKGITIFEANPGFIINLDGIFLDPNEEGVGPGVDTLQYGFDKVSGNANVVCNSGYKKLTCTASGATSYADITLWAKRGQYKTNVPNVYRVSVVDQSDFVGAVIGPQKVINGQPFDMDLSVKSNLGFDIYKLPISIYSVPPVETHFYYPDGTIDGQYWYIDLKSNETQTKKVQVTTPNASEPKNYDLAPKLDGVSSTFTPTVVTSIPYASQYLKDYLSVVGYTPGHRDDGKDNYLPLGIKTVIPFKISNYLDVPVNVYVCKVATALGDTHIYDSEDTTKTYATGNYCKSTKLAPGLIETNIVAKTTVSHLYSPFLFLDLQNVNLAEPTVSQYTSYKYSANTFIVDNSEMQFYFDNLDAISTTIVSPVSGANLTKNTTYDLQVLFENRYAYSLVDVSIGIRIRSDTTSSSYSLENDLFKVLSNDSTINLGYYSSTSIGNKVNKTFKFTTKSLSYNGGGPPFISLSSGYLQDQTYNDKSFEWFIIN